MVYVDIMPWQKQIAWHAAHRLAIALNKDLDRKPTTDVPPLGVVAAVPLRLAEGPWRFLKRDEQRHKLDGWLLVYVNGKGEDGPEQLRLRSLAGEEMDSEIFYDEICHATVKGEDPFTAAERLQADFDIATAAIVAQRPAEPGQDVAEEMGSKKVKTLFDTEIGELAHICRQLRPSSLELSIVDQASKLAIKAHDKIDWGQLLTWANNWANKVFLSSAATGVRCYDEGQLLVVLRESTWVDVSVISCTLGVHLVAPLDNKEAPFELGLHVHNHAPLVMPTAEFNDQRARYETALSTTHATIPDALSGRRLDVFAQCVPIQIVATFEADEDFTAIREVGGVSHYVHRMVEKRRRGENACTNLLVVAGPAAGKTCMTSQLVMEAFRRDDSGKAGLIPIQIKVMDLQRKLVMDVHSEVFGTAWNWVDAYLQVLYGSGSVRYRFLRQALMARRALIILDGIDEGGTNKDRIQKHVTEVLGAQGHPLLVTSRPAGLDEKLYKDFNKLEMKPLTDEQQRMIIEARLKAVGEEHHAEDLFNYIINSMPPDETVNEHGITTSERITGNPLMLTMVTCIYEAQRSVDLMPKRVVELYQMASDIMLSHVERKHRAKGGQPQLLKPLLMRVALLTHSALKRQIVATDIDQMLEDEDDLELQRQLKDTWTSVQQQLVEGRIPLLSMLQREPLEFQFSHLSFQEYFTVCAVCQGLPLRPEVVPWRWSAWWKNVLRFGTELDDFGAGLNKAAGTETIRKLDLSARMLPDMSVVTGALVQLIQASKGLVELDIRDDNVTDDVAQQFADAVRKHSSLQVFSELPLQDLRDDGVTDLDCRDRNYGPTQVCLIANVLESSENLKRLSLWSNPLGEGSEKFLEQLLRKNSSVVHLNLRETNISGELVASALGGSSICDTHDNDDEGEEPLEEDEAIEEKEGKEKGIKEASPPKEHNTTLEVLDVSWNVGVGYRSYSSFASMLQHNKVLTHLILEGCNLPREAGRAFGAALAANGTLRTLQLAYNKLGSGIVSLGVALSSNTSLTSLSLMDNAIDTLSAVELATRLGGNAVLETLDLSVNQLTGDVVTALGTALSSGICNLHNLDLSGSDLSSSAIEALLPNGSPLMRIGLVNCKLSNANALAFSEAITEFSTLVELRLGNNAFDMETRRKLRKAAGSCPRPPRVILEDSDDARYAVMKSRWNNLGTTPPQQGCELFSERLAAALAAGKTEFTRAELDAFAVGEPRHDHYIKVGDSHFGLDRREPHGGGSTSDSDALETWHGTALFEPPFLEALATATDSDNRYAIEAYTLSSGLQEWLGSATNGRLAGVSVLRPGVTDSATITAVQTAVKAASPQPRPQSLLLDLDDLALLRVFQFLTAGGICNAMAVCQQWLEMGRWDFVWSGVCEQVGVRGLNREAYRRRMEAMVSDRRNELATRGYGDHTQRSDLVYDDLVLDTGDERNGLSRFQWQTMSAKRNDRMDVNAFRTRGGFSASTDRFVQIEIHAVRFGDEQFIGFHTERTKNDDPRGSGGQIYYNGRSQRTLGTAPKFYNGDRISLRLDFDEKCALFYLNGELVHTHENLPEGRLYPVAGPIPGAM